MSAVDPAAVATKWAQNLGAASQSIKSGVQGVTESPMAKAAAVANTWQAKMSLPQTLANYVAGLNRTTLAAWQQAFLTKGLPRIASGAQAAMPKFQAFMSQWLPFVQNVAAQVRQMPKLTLEDSIARSTAQIRGNAQFRRS